LTEKGCPTWVRVAHDFLVCCRVFFLTLAGSGLVGYFYGPEDLEVKEFGFGAIRYVEVFFRGYSVQSCSCFALRGVAALFGGFRFTKAKRPGGATLDLGGFLPGCRGLGHGLFVVDRSLIQRLALRSSLSASHVVGED
jgi:hypothetical protein